MMPRSGTRMAPYRRGSPVRLARRDERIARMGPLCLDRTGAVERCRQQRLQVCRRSSVSTTIRVSGETRDRLASLATSTGRPMTRVLDDALEALERKAFFDQLNRRYQELRDNPAAWSAIEDERGVDEAHWETISSEASPR